MFRGASYADMTRYQRCIDLWRTALELRVERDSILFTDTCFSAQALVRLMINYNNDNSGVDTTNQRFKDVLGTFKLLTNNIEGTLTKETYSLYPFSVIFLRSASTTHN